MFQNETIVDDVTGAQIKSGGWAAVRLGDGEVIHVQDFFNFIKLLIDGDKLLGDPEYKRHRLTQLGIIPPAEREITLDDLVDYVAREVEKVQSVLGSTEDEVNCCAPTPRSVFNI